nr:uncharacterized protein LOC128692929 isoform X1 [Cherax quadricarinatus]XP_053638254.1 uncharacterized protein LOC128692929 isoform X1 [Cherax quadricarinatus]XP_053638255.1 uncharacterized protein LOC128692929 isoform X1 [Cherax quadricarinatus]
MDSSLNDQLSQYFDHLLGDSPVNSQTITSKNHTGKPKKKYKHKNILGTDSEESSQQTTRKLFDSTVRKITQNEVILDTDEKATTSTKIKQKSIKVGKGKQSNNNQTNNIEKTCDTHQLKKRGSECQGRTSFKSGERVTEDGFKIVSTIPEDDSDVSDAFEQDDDWEGLSVGSTSYEYNKGKNAEGSSRGSRKNNDGFKIVTEIPPDNNDASGAFHEEDCVDREVNLTEGCQLNGKKTIKKPILQLMNDFGFDDSIFYEKRDHATREAGMLSKKCTSKKRTSNTLAELAKKKQQKEVMILDYSKKRGPSKNLYKSDEENISEVQKPPSEQIMDEKELKRARYDVFKLGMSGFHKEKKEDTRVALAIKLGAKPPKNKAVSYKDLFKMKKEEKQKKLDELDTQKRLGWKVTKSSKCKPKDNKKVKGLSLKLGTYRDGVQVLSKKDIAKINAL